MSIPSVPAVLKKYKTDNNYTDDSQTANSVGKHNTKHVRTNSMN